MNVGRRRCCCCCCLIGGGEVELRFFSGVMCSASSQQPDGRAADSRRVFTPSLPPLLFIFPVCACVCPAVPRVVRGMLTPAWRAGNNKQTAALSPPDYSRQSADERVCTGTVPTSITLLLLWNSNSEVNVALIFQVGELILMMMTMMVVVLLLLM